MYCKYNLKSFSSLSLVFATILSFFNLGSVAQVTISGGTGGEEICFLQSATLTDITITETNANDIGLGTAGFTDQTIIIKPSSLSLEFDPTQGSANVTGSGLSISFSITTTAITLTLSDISPGGGTQINSIILSDIKINSVTTVDTGKNLERTGGTLIINELTTGTSIANIGSVPPPTTANAGLDQAQCNDGDFTLSGINPTIGTGEWNIQGASNGAIIANTSSNTSTVTGLLAGNSVTLRWTITNGTCTPITDDITLTNYALPSNAMAGTDQAQCNDGDFTLSGNTPTSGTGLWGIVGAANGATITTPASPTSTVTGLTAGNSVILRWSISNGNCSTSTDEVVLVNDKLPSKAITGSHQENCNNGNFTLSGNTPTSGTGLWEIIGEANGATITTPTNPTSTVTGLNQNRSTAFVWSISNGSCPSSISIMTLTNNAMPSQAIAGPDQTNCNNGSFNLAATSPNIGLGSWRIVSPANGATITTPISPTSTVIGLTSGSNVTLRWTVNSGSCTPSTDDVVLRNDALPSQSDAGTDQTNCDNGNFTLAGNSPTSGSGVWSIVDPANGATINSPTSPISTVSGLTPGKSVTLRWTVTSGTCSPSTDEVVLRNDALPTTANAGADQAQCSNGNFILSANSPDIGTGIWSIVGDANGATIANTRSNTSIVTGLSAGKNVTLRWTITNGICAASTDDVVLKNEARPIVSSDAATLKNCNNGTFILSGSTPTVGTGVWNFIGNSNGAIITNINDPKSTVTNLSVGSSATLRWTITNGTCVSNSELVVLQNYAPPSNPNAGYDIINCNDGIFVLDGNTPAIGNGEWSIFGLSHGANITAPSDPKTTITNLPEGQSIILFWRITNGICPDKFDDVRITNLYLPSTANAGSDQTQCNNGTFNISAENPTHGVGTWTIVGVGNITAPNSRNTTVTGIPPGATTKVRWVVTNGTCIPNFDEINLTNLASPSDAIAGTDQAQCNNGTFTLDGNRPDSGSGTWSIVSAANGASITDASDHASTVTGLAVGRSVTLRWTITNGTCTPSTDEVTLTNYALPSNAMAGADQAQCNDGDFTLSGNTTTSGTGLWGIVGASNGATITTPASPTSTVTGLTAGNSVTLRWTISSGTCTPSTDEVTLTNHALPSNAMAGADQAQCNNGTFTLAGNRPDSGSGTWSIVSAANGASITDVSDHASTVTGLAVGRNVTLRWTITNGTCTPRTDDVVLRNDALPTPSDAGTDQTKCNTGRFTLAGNSPTSGSGTWSIVGDANGATIDNTTSNTSEVTGLLAGRSVVLRWSINNGTCSPSTDEVTLTNNSLPSIANAGIDQAQCNNGTFTLAGNRPDSGSGTWSIVSAANGASITDVSDHASTVTGLAVGRNVTLRWTITNGTCTPRTDDVVLRNDALPTPSDAGTDQTKCNTGRFTLAGNSPTSGSGTWSIVGDANGATIDNTTSNTSEVTGLLAGRSVVLRWSINNGTCSPSTDEVTLTNNSLPSIANAGIDQAQCNNGTFTLAGNRPDSGSGTWSIVSAANGASITDVSDHASTVTGLAVGRNVTLRWTITNGTCTPRTDDVVLRNDALPTPSDAGTDQTKCNTGRFTLAGNSPTSGSGTWSIVGDANGATIDNTTSNTSEVTGLLAGRSVVLRWSINNGTCSPSTDEVTLTNNSLPSIANAGIDQAQCNNGTFTLAGNRPDSGSGTWSIVSAANGASITDVSDHASTVTGLAVGRNVTLRWTITNGTCTPRTDDVVLRNDALPTPSDAGTDQTKCNTGRFTLAGNSPTSGSGTWSIVGDANGATIDNTTSNTSEVTGLLAGRSVVLRWSINNGTCSPSTDEVTLTNNSLPSIANAGIDQTQCNNGTFTLAGNRPDSGSGIWSFEGADHGASITDETNHATTITGLTAGNSVTFRWTITSGTCAPTSDLVTLTNDNLPTGDISGQATICNGISTNLTFNLTGNGPFNVAYSDGTSTFELSNVTNSATKSVSPSKTTTYTLTRVIDLGTASRCEATSLGNAITVTVNPNPTLTITNTKNSICSGELTDITLNSETPNHTITVTSIDYGAVTGGSVAVNSTYSNGNTIAETLENRTDEPITVTYGFRVTTTDGCPVGANPEQNTTVVVAPRPDMTIANNTSTICSGSATDITLNSSETGAVIKLTDLTGTTGVTGFTSVGVTYSDGGKITDNLVNTTNAPVTITYEFSVSIGNCASNTATYSTSVTINPNPTLTITNAKNSICSGESTDITLKSPTNGHQIKVVSVDYGSGNITGGNISVGNTFNNNDKITETLNNTTSSSLVATYVLQVFTPSTNPNCPLTSEEKIVKVTVLPLPQASAIDQTVCSGETITIPITNAPNNVLGVTYTWTATGTSNVSGYGNGDGSTIIQTLTTTDNNIGTVTYTITPKANGCTGPNREVNVTVNPLPTVNAGADYAICEPSTINLSGTIGGSATSGTWSLLSGGTGTVSTSNTAGTTVTATYTVTQGEFGNLVFGLVTDDPDGLGPCNVATDQLTVKVNQKPTVTVPADFVVCQPASIAIKGTIGGSASSGVWSIVSGDGTLSVSSKAGNEISATYTPVATDVGKQVTFQLQTDDPDSGGPCTSASANLNVTINQSPIMSAGADLSVCENIKEVELQGSFGGSVNQVQWSGGAGSFDNPNLPNATYTYHSSEIGKTITLTLTSNDPDGTDPCEAIIDNMLFTVNRLPNVSFFGLPTTRAQNAGTVEIIANKEGGVFTILPFTPALTNLPSGVGQLHKATFDPAVANVTTYTITYTYTDPNTGCVNSTSKPIEVLPVTSIDWTVDKVVSIGGTFGRQEVCAETGKLRLKGIPEVTTGKAGTRFESSTPGLITLEADGFYYMSTSNLVSATYEVKYTYVNDVGAISILNKKINVHASPKVAIDVASACIKDDIQFNDATTVPQSNFSDIPPFTAKANEWDWNFDDNQTFSKAKNPKHRYTSQGIYNVILKVITDKGCTSTSQKQIRVGPIPEVDFEWTSICSGDATNFVQKVQSGISTVTEYEWDFGLAGDSKVAGPQGVAIQAPNNNGGRTTGTFDAPKHKYNQFGSFKVNLKIKTNDGCTKDSTKNIFILPFEVLTPTAKKAYTENFEANNGGWVATADFEGNGANQYRSDTSWVWGVPASKNINSPGNKAWWTGKNIIKSNDPNADYPESESSYVNGPCFNLTALNRPMISFDNWVDVQESFDGAAVQYSLDGGLNWINVGVINKGLNWFNGQNIVGMTRNQLLGRYGWTKPTNKWVTASFGLEEIPKDKRDFVRFRVAFGTDASTPTNETHSGFAFDNVYVGEKTRHVLLEHFTNANPGGQGTNDYIYKLFDNQQNNTNDSANFVMIQYHLGVPVFDQLYTDNEAEQNARALFYGFDKTPNSILDGLPVFSGFAPNKINSTAIDSLALKSPVFDIKIDTIRSDKNTLNIKTTIKAKKDYSQDLILNVAIVENELTFNGNTYRNVFRKLLYGSDGFVISNNWKIGQDLESSASWTIDKKIYNAKNLAIIAFVQNRQTKEVYQAEYIKAQPKQSPPITSVNSSFDSAFKELQLYPNPVNNELTIASPSRLESDFTWQIVDQRGVNVMNGSMNFSTGNEHKIDTSSIPNGVYYVVIGTENHPVLYHKIVVSNMN